MTELEMFAKLPQLDEDYYKTDLGYVPTLSVIDNILVQYTVYWIDMDTHKILKLYFTANTPEEAIRKAYEWCKDNNLIDLSVIHENS